ncbi:tyrosine-type recombinase/integrase [Spiribacter pallidus]|uniref:tyrosine-type recombinase/integrase n=1 Tax=Spiribacter pallidus TaxID=1987936 RepID=UPI00349F8C92
MPAKSVPIIPSTLVLYQRERSAVWQLRMKLADGKWHRTSTRVHDVDEAKERALDIYYEARAKQRANLPPTSRRFSSIAEMAIRQMEEELAADRGKSVYHSYITALRNVLVPYFGRMRVDSITNDTMAEFEQWRRELWDKMPAASTVTTHNSALKRVFDIAVQQGWATPTTLPTLTNKGKKSNVRPTFSLPEYRRLVQRLRHWSKNGRTERTRQMRELLRDYVLILANTGMRHGTEALNLKWKHIEWYVDLRREQYLQFTVSGKTGGRQLIAKHQVARYLQRIKDRFDDLACYTLDELLDKRVDEYVFRLRDGTRTQNLHQSFEQFLRDADLLYGTTSDKARTLYSLRHFYATMELYRGRNIHQLAVQMGTSVGMLEQHYSKLTPMLLAEQFAGTRSEKDIAAAR